MLGAPSNREAALTVADKVRTRAGEPVRCRGRAPPRCGQRRDRAFPGARTTPATNSCAWRTWRCTRPRAAAPAGSSTGPIATSTASSASRSSPTSSARSLPDEIELHFQPKADAETREVVGVEALVRWLHPIRGFIPPDAFVPLAEHSGLGRALTTRVLDLSLDQCRDWRAAGTTLGVAVNVTVADLLDADFPSEVTAALDARGLPPSALIDRDHREVGLLGPGPDQLRARRAARSGRRPVTRRLRHGLLVTHTSARPSRSGRSRSTARSSPR